MKINRKLIKIDRKKEGINHVIFRPTANFKQNKKTDFSDYQLQHLINFF